MTLLEDLEARPKPKPRCKVCELPYAAEVDEAIRVGLSTGKWTLAQVLLLLRERGFDGGHATLSRHAKEHVTS